MTNSAALPIQSAINGGIGNINKQLIAMIPFHSWPYWRQAGLAAAGLIIFMVILWFWANFWR